MKKKITLRIFFFIIIFFFLLFFFFKSNNKDTIIIKDYESFDEKIDSSNIIKDVSYVSKDSRGNEYKLEAAEGVIDQKENNYIFLTSVKGFISLVDYNLIEISSEFGKYNINNYDTIFSENVIVIYPRHKISGEYLDFSFLSNLGTFTESVVYTGEKTNLYADKIEMNLTTKDTKIFMNDTGKKVLIEGTK